MDSLKTGCNPLSDGTLFGLNRSMTGIKLFLAEIVDPISSASSENLTALVLGLVDPSANHSGGAQPGPLTAKTYRVLGTDPNLFWCDSTVAITRTLVSATPYTCNGLPVWMTTIDADDEVPFLRLEYGSSLIDLLDSQADDRNALADAGISISINSVSVSNGMITANCHLNGHLGSKHGELDVTITYDPRLNKVCADFDDYKNKYIRISDIEVCYYIDQDALCVTAKVALRAAPDQKFDVAACVPVSLLAEPRTAKPCPCS